MSSQKKKLYRISEGFETWKEVIRSDLQDHSKHNGLGRGLLMGAELLNKGRRSPRKDMTRASFPSHTRKRRNLDSICFKRNF